MIFYRIADFRSVRLPPTARRSLPKYHLFSCYENDFSSDDIWNYFEGYFLGNIPDKVRNECLKENPDIRFDWISKLLKIRVGYSEKTGYRKSRLDRSLLFGFIVIRTDRKTPLSVLLRCSYR